MSITLQGQIKQTGRTAINPVSPPEPPPQPYTTATLLHTVTSPVPAGTVTYGYQVAITDTYSIVPDPNFDLQTGRVYVYSNATGGLVRVIDPPTPQQQRFGWDVDIDGDFLIVGASQFDAAHGRAFIFNVTTGDLLHTLNNPTPEDNETFGYGVAIDGNRAIVGARFENTGAAGAGSAYIYDVTTGNLLHTINNPTPALNDEFGLYVDISGNRAIVGARNDDTGTTNAGSAYIYDVTTGNLLHTINNPDPQSGDQFGLTVAIAGSYAIIGAEADSTSGSQNGSAYIYGVTTGNLLQTLNGSELGGNFGRGLAINGLNAVIGAPFANIGATNAGVAYLYDITTGSSTTINNPSPSAEDRYGFACAISGDKMIISAIRADQAYIYQLS